MIRNELFLLRFLNYLFYLIPITLITGPFLPDFFLVIFCIFFLAYIIIFNKWHFFNNYFFYIMLLFNLYIIILSLFSKNPLLSLESSLFYFRFSLFSLGVFVLLEKKIINLKNLFIVFLLLFLFVSLDAYYQFFFNTNIFGNTKDMGRLSGIFGDELVLGSFLARLFPLFFAISYYLSRENKIYTMISLSMFVLIDVLIFLTGERTAFFLLIIYLIIVLALINNMRMVRLLTFIISLLIITTLSFFFPDTKQRMINDTINQLNLEKIIPNIQEENENIEVENLDFWNDKKRSKRILAFSPHHEITYEVSLNIFYDNYLFGIGTKMFREYCNYKEYFIEYACTTHPHNTYIQFLVETGIFGFIFIISTFIFLNYLFIKQIICKFLNRNFLTDTTLLFLGCIYINLWPLTPTGNFFNNWLSIIYYMPVGFVLFFTKKEKYK